MVSIADFFQKHKKNLFNFWTVVYIDKKSIVNGTKRMIIG